MVRVIKNKKNLEKWNVAWNKGNFLWGGSGPLCQELVKCEGAEDFLKIYWI